MTISALNNVNKVMQLSETIQSILRMMSELRPAWSIESLEHGINLEMARVNFPRKKIDRTQAADIFFIVGGFLSDFPRISEHSLFEGYEKNIKSILTTAFLEKVEKLFRKVIDEIEILWNNPDSSIFSILPGVGRWMPEVQSQTFNDIVLLISKNTRSKTIGGFRPQSVLWALYDYILYALTGKRESDSQSSFSFGRYTDAAVKWLISDLKNQSHSKNDNYYGYAVLRNIVAPENVLSMDENTRIRRSTKFEWREILLPFRKSYGNENLLVNEANYLFSKNLDSLCILETTLPGSSRSNLRGKLTEESKKSILKWGEDIRNILYDAVSCMRLVIHPKIGIAFLNHTGIHIETSPLSPLFRPEFHPPPDTQSSITGVIADRRRHYLTFKMYPGEKTALVEFWKQFKTFRYEENRTSFHKSFDRALTRLNLACTEYYIEDAIIDYVICMEIITQGGGPKTSYRVAGFIAPDKKIEIIQKIVSDIFQLRHDYVHGSRLSKEDIEKNLQILSNAQLITRAFLRNTIFYCASKNIPTGKHGFRDVLDSYFIECEKRKEIQNMVPDWSMKDISEIQS